MPVYVDNMERTWRGFKMCHMFADTLEELHDMAKKIGLREQWFQDHKYPHYDISMSKRILAVRNGAIVIDSKQLIAHAAAIRAKR